jgi:hypothetical protein
MSVHQAQVAHAGGAHVAPATRPTDRPLPELDSTAWYATTPPTPYKDDDDQRDADRPTIAADRVAAFAFLLSTGEFACPHVGEANPEVSTQVLAFQTILRQPDAAQAFAALLRRASLPGQLYALCGLYLTDRDTLDRVAPAYFDDQRVVGVAQDCMTYSTPTRLVVRNPAPVTVLLATGQSLEDWQDKHPGGFQFDIVGGGYPNWFANAHGPSSDGE